MTDFFADLEREIRAAHPRRSRPVVPVKGIAASVAMAVTLVAVVLGLGALTGVAEREVAQQPPVPEEGWTAYAPDCGSGKVVDGSIPESVLDRFAILRGDEIAGFPADRIPGEVAEVVRQSVRSVAGPHGKQYVLALVRLRTGEDCEPGPRAICLVALGQEADSCLALEKRQFYMAFWDELDDGGKLVIVVGEDSVRRVSVDIRPPRVIDELDLVANVGFRAAPAATNFFEAEPIDG